jgi:hypothetical protein
MGKESGEESMKHFAAQEWVDFVRGTVREDLKAAMQEHLSGCQKCQREARTWLRVRETAGRQSAAEPDDSVVRFVKGSFAISGAKRSIRPSRGFLAEVLFDSSREPLPAGVRSAVSCSRQLLYGAGDLRIDLRLEPQVDSESVSLIGQILDSANPETGPTEASVALLKAGKVVSEAKTNRFGEFRLECALGSRLELRIALPARKQISISLIDPVPGADKTWSDTIDSKMVRYLRGVPKSTGKRD